MRAKCVSGPQAFVSAEEFCNRFLICLVDPVSAASMVPKRSVMISKQHVLAVLSGVAVTCALTTGAGIAKAQTCAIRTMQRRLEGACPVIEITTAGNCTAWAAGISR